MSSTGQVRILAAHRALPVAPEHRSSSVSHTAYNEMPTITVDAVCADQLRSYSHTDEQTCSQILFDMDGCGAKIVMLRSTDLS